MNSQVVAANKPKQASALMAPVRMARRLMNGIGNPFGPTDVSNSAFIRDLLFESLILPNSFLLAF